MFPEKEQNLFIAECQLPSSLRIGYSVNPSTCLHASKAPVESGLMSYWFNRPRRIRDMALMARLVISLTYMLCVIPPFIQHRCHILRKIFFEIHPFTRFGMRESK